MGCALDGVHRASPSGPPDQAPRGVGCLQRPPREHERPAPRLRVRSFPATNDPAGNTTSADCSTANRGLSTAVVHHHPANQTDEASGTPAEPSASKTSNLHRTPTAFTKRPLDGIGLRLVVQTRPDRPAFYAQPAQTVPGPDAPCVPRVATSHSRFLPTQPHNQAVAIGSWLVPSTPTGDSHPRATAHAARTPWVRGLPAQRFQERQTQPAERGLYAISPTPAPSSTTPTTRATIPRRERCAVSPWRVPMIDGSDFASTVR
jgi:hypothetical protein